MKLIKKDKLELRKAFFLEAFDREVETMAIVSFGRCNFKCSYCKRDGQFTDDNGDIINTVDCSLDELKALVDDAVAKGRRVRLSGGDPCTCIQESVQIAQYIFDKYHQKISIAHNGSYPNLVRFLMPYLDYVAIDLKSPYPDVFSEVTGCSDGDEMIKRSLLTQKLCTSAGVLVDVRTCVFDHTPLEELLRIAELITAENKLDNLFWTLRVYSPVEGCGYKQPALEKIKGFIAEIKAKYPKLKIGMRNKWEGGFNFF